MEKEIDNKIIQDLTNLNDIGKKFFNEKTTPILENLNKGFKLKRSNALVKVVNHGITTPEQLVEEYNKVVDKTSRCSSLIRQAISEVFLGCITEQLKTTKPDIF